MRDPKINIGFLTYLLFFDHYSRIGSEIFREVFSVVIVVKWFSQTQKRLRDVIFHLRNIQVIQNNKSVIEKMESLRKVAKRWILEGQSVLGSILASRNIYPLNVKIDSNKAQASIFFVNSSIFQKFYLTWKMDCWFVQGHLNDFSRVVKSLLTI